jgi:6-methylsalicylate decarboxylase
MRHAPEFIEHQLQRRKKSVLSTIKSLDVHAHFLPAPYLEALRSAGVTTVDNGLPIPHWDADQAIEAMNEGDIGCAMLSVSSPFLHFVEQAQTPALCRTINDSAAEIVANHPARFGAMMILPLPDIDASLTELERAYDTVGLEGVCIPSNARGLYPGDATMFPILAELDRRKASVFIHPTMPCCFEVFNLSLPAPFIEFPFETTRAVASLLFGGALSRYPDIRFILPHAGGTIPFLENRICGVGASPYVETRRDREQTRRMLAALYYDTVTAAQVQFDALRALVPISNIVFGSDYPWNPSPPVSMTAAFRQLQMNERDQSMILQGNAAKLFPDLHKRCFGQ